MPRAGTVLGAVTAADALGLAGGELGAVSRQWSDRASTSGPGQAGRDGARGTLALSGRSSGHSSHTRLPGSVPLRAWTQSQGDRTATLLFTRENVLWPGQ